MAIQSVTQSEALQRARTSSSTANFSAIFEGFESKGIPAAEIEPRVNVLTYNAWLALGRQVRRGEHGVKVCTFVSMTKKNESGVAESIGRHPRGVTVFHVSQTDPVQA
jgi:antirestriction protein ArdC